MSSSDPINTQAGSTTYAYDNNGNMTSGDGRTITWNYDNMPSSITMGGTTSFVYDYQKQRVKKIGASTTIYIGTLYEITGGSYTKYIFAGKKRIVNKTASETNYYHTDHLGSSNVITNVSGALVEEIYYFPFGGIRLDTDSVDVKHKYTGQELDEETDLYYYGARYYDAVLARFISPDSVVPDYTDPQSLNRYSYVLNNPVRYIDPTGNQYSEEDLAFGNIWAGWSTPGSFISSVSQSSNWSITTNLYPYSFSSMTYTEYLLSGGSSSGFSTGILGTNVSQGFNVITGSEYMIMSQATGGGIGGESMITCVGIARFSAIGPQQALGQGALGPYGVTPSIGTVAVDPRIFGLAFPNVPTGKDYYTSPEGIQREETKRTLANIRNQIIIRAEGLNLRGGPSPPYTVSDIGDIYIRQSTIPRFDIYGFPTQGAAIQFGIQDVTTTITIPLCLSCPPGFGSVP